MPIVPAPQKQPANIRQLPGVQGFTVSADEMGAGAWDALPKMVNAISREVTDGLSRRAESRQRAGELLDAETAEKAVTAYLEFADQTLNGAVGEDGQVTGGILSLTGGEAHGSAAEWKRVESGWQNKPGGVYANLTDPQRKIYKARIEGQAQRFGAATIKHELQQAEAGRKADVDAWALTARSFAQHAYESADADFEPALADYAEAEADRATFGNWRREPDGRRTFKSPEVFAQWNVVKANAGSNVRVDRASHLADKAVALPLDDPQAPTLIARIDEQAKAEELDPAATLRINAVADQVRARRAQMEQDAFEQEKKDALGNLARGLPYDVGGVPRKQAALEWAQVELETRRAKEDASAASARGRQVAADSKFLSAFIEGGVVIDSGGNPRALSTDDALATARSELAAGHLKLADFDTLEGKLNDRAQDEDKAAYERARGDVAAALGETIKTVWGPSGATLAADADPAREVSTYDYRYLDESRGKKKLRDEKRRILENDVPRIINLLAESRRLDSVPLDLDGNVATPDTKFDYARYRDQLLRELRDKVLTVDLDAQAVVIQNALARRRQNEAVGRALAIRSAHAARQTKPEQETPYE